MPYLVLGIIFDLLGISNFIIAIIYKCKRNKPASRKGIKIAYQISIILLVIAFAFMWAAPFQGTTGNIEKTQVLISNIISFLSGFVLIFNIVSVILLTPERKKVIREEYKERIAKNKNENRYEQPIIVEWEKLEKKDKQKYLDYAIELYYETILELDNLSEEIKVKVNNYLSENNYKIEDIDKDHHQMIYDKAKEIYENEKGSFEDNQLIDDFYGLTTKKQNKIINEVCLRLFEKELIDKEIHKDLTKEQIEYRRQAVKNRQVDYNKLIDEEKIIVNDLINKKAREYSPKSEEYAKSKRYKFEIGQIVSILFLFVSIGVAIYFSINSNGTSPWMYIFYFVAIAMIITASCLGNAKRPYCKKCGCKGMIVDYQNENHYEINREKLTSAFGQGTAVFWARDGHVSFDNKGNAYKEKLSQVTTHKHKYTCPCCNYDWTLKSTTRK